MEHYLSLQGCGGSEVGSGQDGNKENQIEHAVHEHEQRGVCPLLSQQ